MLTSSGHATSAERCRELGLAAYLVKPIKQSELLQALRTVVGTARRPDTAPAIALQTFGFSQLRILLAEDQVINQRVATRLLENEGHSVTVVSDGREVLRVLEGEHIDLILMDVQMPELDGFQTAAEIRKREQGTNRRVPIIALTAHAMKGDRERCLAAGMDGYLSKPIRADELRAALAGLGGMLPHGSETPAATFDRADLLGRLYGDRKMARELVDLFQVEFPQQLAAVRAALAKHHDGTALKRAAHAIKGALANLSAPKGRALAEALEMLAGTGDFGAVAGVVVELEKEVERFKEAAASI
jgi:CheY-like chemotaxis protein